MQFRELNWEQIKNKNDNVIGHSKNEINCNWEKDMQIYNSRNK